MSKEVDTLNQFLVTSNAEGDIIIGAPPHRPITGEEALVMAAWLVTLAMEPRERFDEVRRAVENC